MGESSRRITCRLSDPTLHQGHSAPNQPTAPAKPVASRIPNPASRACLPPKRSTIMPPDNSPAAAKAALTMPDTAASPMPTVWSIPMPKRKLSSARSMGSRTTTDFIRQIKAIPANAAPTGISTGHAPEAAKGGSGKAAPTTRANPSHKPHHTASGTTRGLSPSSRNATQAARPSRPSRTGTVADAVMLALLGGRAGCPECRHAWHWWAPGRHRGVGSGRRHRPDHRRSARRSARRPPQAGRTCCA